MVACRAICTRDPGRPNEHGYPLTQFCPRPWRQRVPRRSTTHPSGGWGGHWPIRTAIPPTAKGKGKEAMEPGKEAMDIEPMDYDMISCLDSARPILPPTDVMLVDQDPEHHSTSFPTGVPRKSSRGPKTSKSHKWAKSGHGGHQREDFKGLGWQSSGRHRRHQPDPPL